MNTLRNILTLIVIPLYVHSQGNWDIGMTGGGSTYQGDLVLTTEPLLSETNPAYGLFLRHTFDFQWSVRMNLLSTELSGSDQNFQNKDRNNRNFFFQSDLYEAAVLLEWEPLGKRRIREDFNFHRILSPYLFVGFGALAVDSKPNFYISSNDGIIDRIEQDQSINNPHLHPLVPFGVGVKLDLSKSFLLSAEISSRAAFTDYLDGISQSANPAKNDWYLFGGLSVAYRFKAKDQDKDNIADRVDACPKIPGVISSRGCPDADADGVEDLEDLCPEEPGIPALNGCPDRDSDGIADWEDQCPGDPGSVFTLGCPDTDGDKIADADDPCPYLPGCLCRGGCPALDTTGDGLPDQKDRCTSDLNTHLLSLLKQIEPLQTILEAKF